ncbi:dihydrofolate reductase family protein [Gordonia sp. SL306]|uniref:dihydrofolate reductase family protein n=1 Tax=Gordonia sp. SL306 TaxID=2995145 RepID=UPI002271B8E3|nr:dihydrofolate reductase family protein [Gordonia sp. SL306]WAC55264.1 dihydrofolate reductase family protein [Gordonia sp. SL306]
MGEIVVTEYVSVDGVMEAPGGEEGYPHTGWTIGYHTPELREFKRGEVIEAEAHLLGRRTYESFAGAWPHYEDDDGFADKMNTMPKYVVTSTLTDLAWNNSSILDGPVVTSVRRLRDAIDGVVLVAGSRMLVHALLEHGLVDELRLTVFPIILGSGFRVFPDTEQTIPLASDQQHVLADGVRVDTYRLTVST